MADYPLTKLEKALARRAATSSSRTAWQELMERYDTVPSSKSVQAPDAITGFSGSWAASYDLGGSLRDMAMGESPAQIQRRTNLLGQPGMAEINFRPYDHGTNRHGKYGPSLLGHPISFQVVGPTAKTRGLIHQWFISEAGGIDTLNLDVGSDINSTTVSSSALPGTADTIGEIYGFTSIPEGGIYVVVTMTGSEGIVTDNDAGGTDGGLGDGFIGEDDVGDPIGAGARLAVIPRTESAKYEVFRVTAMTPTTLVLDNAKRLVTYFDYNIGANAPVIRAITILRPAATRLVAAPGSGSKQGSEQTFAFVPPATALNADWQPVYASAAGTGLVDPWTSGKELDTNPAWGFAYNAKDYDQAVALPIPVPVNRGQGRLQGIQGEAPAQLTLGRLRIVVDPVAGHFDKTNDVGKIVHIHDIRRVLDGNWETADSEPVLHRGKPLLDRMLGYFEIVNANDDFGGLSYYDLRFIPQVDPDTGVPFLGGATTFVMATGSGAGQEVQFQWTLHDPIEALWTDTYLHPTRLDSARLKNLIDPRWVKPTLKGRELANMAGHQALPDRAVFDTSSSGAGAAGTNANPGSLLDLGFRVVLFPARVIGAPTTSLVPDFDNPIDANEVVLDTTKPDENQFIEVDYSAGLVHLSHPPVVGSPLLPVAGILTADDNPRGEAVFFAACVPFSREPGQMGVNPRVTAGQPLDRAGSFCGLDSPEPVDVYGGRIFWPGGADPTLPSGPQGEIRLGVELSPLDLPLTGFVDVLLGDINPAGDPVFANVAEERLCTFGYSTIEYNDVGNGGHTTLLGTFGGADPAATYAVVPGVTPVTVVLRKNIVLPNTPDGRAGTDYQFDTTYGHAKRPAALRFTHGDLTPEHDGTVSISTKDPRTDAHEALFSELFSSWCISGGENQTAIPTADATLHFTSAVVLIQGIRTVMPEQDVVVGLGVGAPRDRYVYIDGSTPACPVWASTDVLPLPSNHDVLMASYTHNGVIVQGFTDLRDPLVDIDKRLEVTVGNPQGHGQPGHAHFNELADAVAFVTETYRAFQISGAPGEEGRARRIKVIGPTREDNAKLPITPRLGGVIIEGAARTSDDTAANPLSITWGGEDAPPLFDLSDVTGWTFRDLAFRFLDSAVSAVVKDRCLFVTTAGATRDCTFENIYLLGKAHGFYYCDDTASPGSAAYDNLLFRNCDGPSLTDFGIRVEANIDASNADVLNVEGCDFTVAKGAGRELNGVITDGAIVHIGTTHADRLTLRDCRLIGGNVGVFSAGIGNVVDGCLIRNTDLPAIWVKSDFWEINNNDINLAHTVAVGPLNPAKVAVYIDAGGAGQNEVHVTNNRVDISGGAAGDRAIYNDGNTVNCVFSGNSVDFDIVAGTAHHILDNDITDALGVLSFDAGCTVRGNFVAGDLTPLAGLSNISNNNVAGLLLGVLGINCRYSNNLFLQSEAAKRHVTGAGSTFHGDGFGDPTSASSGGRVSRQNDNTFVGVHFADGFDDFGGTRKDRNKFEACEINLWTDIVVIGNSTVFVGNIIQAQDSDQDIHLEGQDNSFVGNQLTIDTLHLEGLGGALDHITVVGNHFHQNPVDPGGLYLEADQSTVSDNVIEGWETRSGDPNKFSIVALGEGNVITGNRCNKGMVLSGSSNMATGNFVGTNLFLSINENATAFKANTVDGTVTLKGAAAVLEFNDNHIGGALAYDAVGDYLNTSTFCGNRMGSTTIFAPDVATPSLKDTVVNGNNFIGDFSAQESEDCTFTGNRSLGNVILTKAAGLLCNNNRIGTNGAAKNLGITETDDYVCNGNYVVGDIVVDDAGVGAGAGILVGNRAEVIGQLGAPLAGQVAIGNRTTDDGANPTLFNTNTGVVADIGVTVPSNLNTEV
jgi:hypothetical protein